MSWLTPFQAEQACSLRTRLHALHQYPASSERSSCQKQTCSFTLLPCWAARVVCCWFAFGFCGLVVVRVGFGLCLVLLVWFGWAWGGGGGGEWKGSPVLGVVQPRDQAPGEGGASSPNPSPGKIHVIRMGQCPMFQKSR